MQTLPPKTRKALEILRDHPGLSANRFATEYFDAPQHNYLFTAVSNQGEGACAGKKAWLCAGSILGKLRKQGLVTPDPYSNPTTWRLTAAGADKLA